MTAKLVVTFSGILLIILVNWYFFFSKRKTKTVSLQDKGIQKLEINVKGGYDLDVIEIEK
jgi:plastocyanin domain-containing protein